jgi:hypothetical protein
MCDSKEDALETLKHLKSRALSELVTYYEMEKAVVDKYGPQLEFEFAGKVAKREHIYAAKEAMKEAIAKAGEE